MSLADPATGLPPTTAEQLPDDVATLKRMVLELLASLHQRDCDIEGYRHRIDLLLRRLYGMTKAEAAVAIRLLRGDGIKPIADSMCLSTGTVKTHVQHIFNKTNTHRQAELVRLLLTIAL